MTIEVNVNAERVNGSWKLTVNNGHPVEIPRGKNPQTIQWQLTGNAATGTFLDPDGSPRGFEWADGETPHTPSGQDIFTDLSLSSNAKMLSIDDDNESQGDQGEWGYRLRARIDGQIAESDVMMSRSGSMAGRKSTATAAMAINSPTIRNT